MRTANIWKDYRPNNRRVWFEGDEKKKMKN